MDQRIDATTTSQTWICPRCGTSVLRGLDSCQRCSLPVAEALRIEQEHLAAASSKRIAPMTVAAAVVIVAALLTAWPTNDDGSAPTKPQSVGTPIRMSQPR